MATEFHNTGAFNVNGQWATAVRYEAMVERGAIHEVQLRFLNGRTELAAAKLAREDARELLGEKNYALMHKGVVDAQGPAHDGGTYAAKGELRGKSLEFRQVTLPGYEFAQSENTIALDSRARRQALSEARDAKADPLTARDYVVGGAHAAQAAGAGGAAMQAGAAAAGVADAAKLAVDAAHGDRVRPIDAAAAAASVVAAAGAGAGGPAAQGAAKAAQTLGAAETGLRAAMAVEDQPRALAGDPAAAGGAAGDPDEPARLQRLRAAAVPDAVAARFLKVGDKYFFPDKTLAFIDRGTKLEAESHNIEVVRSVVSIAEARGWDALSVTGTHEFRKEVWREAGLRGIDVRGYEPSELERAELQRAIEKRDGPNGVQREARERAATAPARDPQHARGHAAPPAADARSAAEDRPALLTGTLVASGAAPYRFDPREKHSYYVKLKTDRGERILWGVDLERALAESKTGVKPGDAVAVENQGSKRVTVSAPVRDEQGNIVAEKQLATHRNAWAVEKPGYFDERAEKAAAFRNGDRAKDELIARYPDLTNAIATMRIGELFAEKMIDRPEDRRRLVESLRENLAQALERGETIHAPKVKEAAVRKLQKLSGDLDEVAQRTDADKAAKGAREVGARARTEPQHVRA